MKKRTCLTLLALVICCASQAQHGPAINFNAVMKESNRSVSLQWDADSAFEGDYFIVERGQEGHFETIGALRSTGVRGHYELSDQAPPNGLNYYRIKYTGKKDTAVYSRTVELSISGDVDFKFYPNPVDKVFIVRTEHSLDLQIIDPSGNTRVSKRLQPGLQVVSVGFLERGVYVIRVTDKESNRVVSQQLVKN
ncbi:MAG TPA: T9SS type A sorting domain-containing protein [Puia sp.]|uniref:T9SS type A sorting domain-containing protein n=1 Tax=Puia sp. TaxID=2045100 RepID=UPI002CED056F|nr:T9SS type A sorting domain-containing protein [Puia sp.]HVU97255.1 T9SS type A sorting domain-containing protein [Puia sp.]